jgi:hypothetical protein
VSEPDDLLSLAGARLAEYAKLWEEVGAKMSAGTYRSEDLVTDWSRWCGMAARDTTAAITVAMRAARAGVPDEPDEPDKPDEPGGAEGTGG